jgi:hypothetical protein
MNKSYLQNQLFETKKKWKKGEAHESYLLGSLDAILESFPDIEEGTINDYNTFRKELLYKLGTEEKLTKRLHRFWYNNGRRAAIKDMKRKNVLQ